MSRACAKLDEVVAEILWIVGDDKTASRRADDGRNTSIRHSICAGWRENGVVRSRVSPK